MKCRLVILALFCTTLLPMPALAGEDELGGCKTSTELPKPTLEPIAWSGRTVGYACNCGKIAYMHRWDENDECPDSDERIDINVLAEGTRNNADGTNSLTVEKCVEICKKKDTEINKKTLRAPTNTKAKDAVNDNNKAVRVAAGATNQTDKK